MKKVKLGEVATFINGYAFKPQDWSTEGKEIIRIQNLTKTSKEINYYSGKIDKKYIVETGDILISWSGTIGVFQWYGKTAVLNQHIFKVVFDKLDLDRSYFKYVVEKGLQDALKNTHGSTMKHLTKKYFDNIVVSYTSFKEQQRISSKLDLLSNLILMRQEQLEDLNLLVKSRFNEMFGDDSKFDVERLNNSVTEMFIGPFGSSLKNDYFVSKEKAYCMVYEQKHAIKKTMNLETRYVDEKKYKELKRFSIYGGDIIVSCRGTIGEIFQVPNNAPLGIMHPSIMKIRLDNSKYNPIFFKFMLSDYMDIEKIKSKGRGVKMAITASELGKIGFPLPPLSLQNEFADFVAQVDKSQLAIQKSLEELETLKKSLMQEYFG